MNNDTCCNENENGLSVELHVTPRFRSETRTLTGGAAKTGEWRETYEEAEADMAHALIDAGINHIGEVDKVYATSNTWIALDEAAAEKAAKA